MNQEFFNSLRNRNVQDLYWLVFKTSPLKSCPQGFEITFFPQDIIDAWEADAKDYFLQLDDHPSNLIQFVDRKKNYRLGFYAESLLSYFFQTFPGIELLIQNFQITVDKKTIGEIDFVILWNNRVLHIELAVKYYLLLPQSDPNTASHWVGPSRKDDLQKKLTKIQEHQIPLGKHQYLRDSLPKLDNKSLESFFLFRGQFFWKEKRECDFLNRVPLQYFYNEELKEEHSKIKVLKRPDWLGSIDREPSNDNADLRELDRPQMIKISQQDVAFVVPDHWND